MGPGPWDPLQSLKVGPQDPLQNLKVGPQDPFQSLKVGPPHLFLMNKIYSKKKWVTEIIVITKDKQVYLNRTPVDSNPFEVITFLDRHSLAILLEVYL